MITEGIVLVSFYAAWRYYTSDKVIIRKNFEKMVEANKEFQNKQEETPILRKILVNEEDDKVIKTLTVDIKNVVGFEKFMGQKDYIVTSFNCDEIGFNKNEKGLVEMTMTYSKKEKI